MEEVVDKVEEVVVWGDKAEAKDAAGAVVVELVQVVFVFVLTAETGCLISQVCPACR
ncbi:hypothetical protein [Candidatus Desulfofervidus auxilii]|uniref:hypothetical protein n=1 Tax=Desulfofervidus auxilii TaxID=1621989 RepID=UPI0012E95571|nr:hypothetical protein [Candidatus Desulfofervidus auxilii]MCD6214205.1 hypothetical protein [Candidatus Desulfofervidus sp.]